MFRKREEEQRRREAVSTAEKWKVSLVKAEQEKLALVNIMEDLSMNDSVVETKKSAKADSTKNKEERHTGTSMWKSLKQLAL